MPDFTTLVGKYYNYLYTSETKPTLTSGAGTGATITGTSRAFTIVVGSSPGSAIVLGMPTASNGWVIHATNQTQSGAALTQLLFQGAGSTTSVTINAFDMTGSAASFTASDILKCKAESY